MHAAIKNVVRLTPRPKYFEFVLYSSTVHYNRHRLQARSLIHCAETSSTKSLNGVLRASSEFQSEQKIANQFGNRAVQEVRQRSESYLAERGYTVVRLGSTVFRSSVYRRFWGRRSCNGTVDFSHVVSPRVATHTCCRIEPKASYVPTYVHTRCVLRRPVLSVLRVSGCTYTCTNAFCCGEAS